MADSGAADSPCRCIGSTPATREIPMGGSKGTSTVATRQARYSASSAGSSQRSDECSVCLKGAAKLRAEVQFPGQSLVRSHNRLRLGSPRGIGMASDRVRRTQPSGVRETGGNAKPLRPVRRISPRFSTEMRPPTAKGEVTAGQVWREAIRGFFSGETLQTATIDDDDGGAGGCVSMRPVMPGTLPSCARRWPSRRSRAA